MSVVVKSVVRVGSKLTEKMRVTLYALGKMWAAFVISVREGRCARWMLIVKEVWGRCKSIREFIHLYYADDCILWVCACVLFNTYNTLFHRLNLRQPCRCFDVFMLYLVISVGLYL